METVKTKFTFTKYWELLLFLGLTIFNVGYTAARINEFATKEYVTSTVDEKIRIHKEETRDMYIRIDQVPGLVETLNSINEKLDNIQKRLEKLEDRN